MQMEKNKSFGEIIVTSLPVVLTAVSYLSIYTGNLAGAILVPMLALMAIGVSTVLLLLHLLSNIQTVPSSKIFIHPIVFSCLLGIFGSGGLIMCMRGLLICVR